MWFIYKTPSSESGLEGRKDPAKLSEEIEEDGTIMRTIILNELDQRSNYIDT